MFLLFTFTLCLVQFTHVQARSRPQGKSFLVDILMEKQDALKYLAKPRKLEAFGGENCNPGKWFEEEFWGDECHNCQTGRYQNQWSKSSSCKGCTPGKYQGSNGQSHCNVCTYGQYQGGNYATVCGGCIGGQYTDQNQQTVCKGCPSGWQQPFTYASGCIECSPGFYQLGVHCAPCGMNNPVCNGDSCTGTVTGGQYQNLAAQTSCKSCPIGQYQISMAQAACTNCPAGYKNNVFGKGSTDSCSPCAQGYFALEGAHICIGCPSGYYVSGSGESTCTSCGPGFYQSSPAQYSACTGCAVGRYQNNYGQSSCINCLAGNYQGATSQVTCKQCPVGQFNVAPEQDSCVNCPAGTSSAAGTSDSSCTKCAVGYYLPESSAGRIDGCLHCPGSETEGDVVCAGCAAGKAENTDEPPSCENCAVGKYGDTLCINCPAGYYQSLEAQSICHFCEPGKWSAATAASNDNTCKNCPIGTYSASPAAVQVTSCKECNPGYYNPTLGQNHVSDCLACLPGKFSLDYGRSTNCEICVVGKYSANAASTSECVSCPSGWYQDSTSQSMCRACLPGKRQGSIQQIGCEDCAAGKFNQEIKSTTCQDCDAGFYQAKTGQILCFPCMVGRSQESRGMQSCVTCSEGKYRGDTNLASSTCLQCPKGYSQSTLGAVACTKCNVGTYTNQPSSSSCLTCNSGLYLSEIGKTSCKPCPIGMWTDTKEGANSCSNCPAGTSGEQCKMCLVGTFRGTRDSPTAYPCPNCPSGWFQNTNGSSVCLRCIPGTFANNNGSLGCRDCPIGWYQDSLSSSECIACLPGKLQASVQQQACEDCAAGRFNAASQSTACEDCDAGFYKTQSGAGACVPCEVGRSQNSPGSSECIACLPGKRQASVQQQACEDCAAGRFNAASQSIACEDCDAGFYKTQSGAGLCGPCIPGTYAEKVGSLSCTSCPLGWLQAKQNGSLCDFPPPGSIAGEGGSSIVTVAPGWRINSALSPPMEECQPGTVGTDPPSEICLQCPPGKDSQKASMICHECPTGRYATETGTESCMICDKSTRKYSDVSGAIECKTCVQGKMSKSFPDGCESQKNLNLPRPSDIHLMSISNVTDEQTLAGISSSTFFFTSAVMWDIDIDDDIKLYDIAVSTHGDFDDIRQNASNKNVYHYGIDPTDLCIPSNTSATKLTCTFSLLQSIQPLWRSVLYIQIRSVGLDYIPGSWSFTSKSWKVAAGCSNATDDSQYLSVGTMGGTNPLDYTCKPCPVGGSCDGAVIASDVRAMFGWWQCSNNVPLPTTTTIVRSTNVDERRSGMRSSTKTNGEKGDAPSFSLCGTTEACLGATNSLLLDAKGESNYQIIQNGKVMDLAKTGGPSKWKNGSRCAIGYRNPSSSNRRCTDCDVGYVRTGEFGTCSLCPAGVASLLVPTAVIVASLIFIALLVALKVRSTGSKRAPHTVLRRTLLHHLQTLAIIMSLNVQWPQYLVDGLSFLSAVVSTSDHMSMLKCSRVVADQIGFTASSDGALGEIVLMGKEATFFYSILVSFLGLPGLLSIFGYIYWVCFAESYSCLRCGVKLHPRGASNYSCLRNKKRKQNINISLTNGGKTGNENENEGVELTEGMRKSDGMEVLNEVMHILHTNPDPNNDLQTRLEIDAHVAVATPVRNIKESSLSTNSTFNTDRLTINSTSTTGTTDLVASTNPMANQVARPSFKKNTLDCAIATAVLILYLFYPSLVRMAFSVLECENVCGEQWLHRDQQEPCWSGRHLDFVLFISIPALFVFLILFPGLSTLFLWKRRHKLYRDRRMTFRFGMLYSGYRREYWWWELLVLLRKFAIILIVTFGRNFGRQLHVALGALIIFYHLQHTAAPYPKTKDGMMLHKVELESIIVLLTMTWVAVFFTVSHCEENDQSCKDFSLLLGVVLIIMNIVFLLKAMWFTVKKFNEKEKVVSRIRNRFARSSMSSKRSTTLASRVPVGTSAETRGTMGKKGQAKSKGKGKGKKKKKLATRHTVAGNSRKKDKQKKWNFNPADRSIKDNEEDNELNVHVRGTTIEEKMYMSENLLFKKNKNKTKKTFRGQNETTSKYWDANISKHYFHDTASGETWWEEDGESDEEDQEQKQKKEEHRRFVSQDSVMDSDIDCTL